MQHGMWNLSSLIGINPCSESCSVMSDSVTPWTVARPATLSMEFSRQEYWSGLPFPSPGDLPDSGIESGSPALHIGSATREAVEVQSSNYWAAREFLGCGYFQSEGHDLDGTAEPKEGASCVTGTEPAVMATGTIQCVQ